MKPWAVFITLIVLLLSACIAPAPTLPTASALIPATASVNSSTATQGDFLQAVTQFQAVAGLPNSPLEFVELTTMINSPDGRLRVALYQDSDGRKFSLDSTIAQVVEMDARALLPSLSSEANPLTLDELRIRAENLVAATTLDFDHQQADLTYDEGAKGDLYFFDWRGKPSATRINPPLAQVGLHTNGELIAYINTLGVK